MNEQLLLAKAYIAWSYCTEFGDSGDGGYKKSARSRISMIKMAFNWLIERGENFLISPKKCVCVCVCVYVGGGGGGGGGYIY